MNINGTPEQFNALITLLNVGLRSGAYDLSQAEAVVFWARKIEEAGKQLNTPDSEKE